MRRGRQGGFTLLELLIAMSVFAFVVLGLYGVIVLGARSAGSGERVTEQARRYRVANEVITRQVASAAPICLPKRNKDDDELGFKNPTSHDQTTDDSDEEDDEGDDDAGDDDTSDDDSEVIPFFVGQSDAVQFVTSAPQRPDSSGLAIVTYWVEDGTLRMSERPVITAWSGRRKDDRNEDDDAVSTILLYDVESVEFAYLRESDDDEWLEEWDARDEDMLPAVVRIDVRPSAVGGPDFYHEIAVMVGSMNQVAEHDEDFPCSGG